MKKARLYYTRDYSGNLMKSVTALPRSQQKKCKHKWKRRSIQEVKSGWASVCCLCGALARGRK